jgi:hypothetical protein
MAQPSFTVLSNFGLDILFKVMASLTGVIKHGGPLGNPRTSHGGFLCLENHLQMENFPAMFDNLPSGKLT